jgi:hypothetical protein
MAVNFILNEKCNEKIETLKGACEECEKLWELQPDIMRDNAIMKGYKND